MIGSVLANLLGIFFLAHAGHETTPELLTPENIWSHWNWNVVILAGIGLSLLFYFRGVYRFWQAGIGRGIRVWQVLLFAMGILALIAALVSPLDLLGEVLFSGHMLQHLLLMIVAAPLLVLGLPHTLLKGLTPAWRKPIIRLQHLTEIKFLWRWIANPVVIWGIHAGLLWLWHVPLFYELALEHETIHLLEHASFFLPALIYWWGVIHPQDQLGLGMSALSIFTIMIQSGLLGALITFAPTAWYESHLKTTANWGLTPLEDQQLAGVIMWIPSGVIYLLSLLIILAVWLHKMDQADQAVTAVSINRS